MFDFLTPGYSAKPLIPEDFINPPIVEEETVDSPCIAEFEGVENIISNVEIQSLYEPACQIIRSVGHASVGMLINRMKISAIKADRLMKELIVTGFIDDRGRMQREKTNWGKNNAKSDGN